jgi:hypothetical protein
VNYYFTTTVKLLDISAARDLLNLSLFGDYAKLGYSLVVGYAGLERNLHESYKKCQMIPFMFAV